MALKIQRRAQLTIRELREFLSELPEDVDPTCPIFLNDSSKAAFRIYLDEDGDGPYICINGA